MSQRATLQSSATFSSLGVHSGKDCTLTILPETAGNGIYFVRTDISNDSRVDVTPSNVIEGERATYLKNGDITVQTPEHILSALAGLGITDCRLELNGPEVPILDGSALEYTQAILKGGINTLEKSIEPITLNSPLCVKFGPASIIALPAHSFTISYCLDYSDTVIGQQFLSLKVNPESYTSEIAPARTFGFYSDLKPLLEKGLSQGASLDNVLVIGENDYMNTPRLEMEEVRHKILDVIGDFSLLGAPLNIHLVCVASGHALNRSMVLKLAQLL